MAGSGTKTLSDCDLGTLTFTRLECSSIFLRSYF
jgi:hypothetical protein